MFEIIGLGIIIYLFYYLFIKGAIWPILLFIIGVGGGRMLVKQYIPITNTAAITLSGYNITWATVICFIIVTLALGVVTKEY